MPEEKFKYDVFLSHSSKDKPAVRELAEKLKSDGLRVWFDEGDSTSTQIEEGLEQSRVLILAMSENAFSSEWVALERHTALFRDPADSERRFIPLLLEDCEIKPMLRQFAYTDWRARDESQYRRLLSDITDDETQAAEDSRAGITRTGNTQAETTSDESVRILKNFLGQVNSVAISSDGKLIVSGSDDATVKIWETETGKCLKTLKGHSNLVWSVALSDDNKLIVSGSGDDTIRIWETETGKCLKTLKGHSDSVSSVTISTDKNLIISGSDDETVRVWETETGKCLKTLEGHSDSVSSVALSTNNKLIVSGSEDVTVRIWETETGKCLKTLEGHSESVSSVAISTDKKLVVSGSEDVTVRIWETETGKCLKTLEGHSESVSSVAISTDKKLVVSGSFDETIRLWDISSLAGTVKESSIEIPEAGDEEYEYYTNAKVLLVGDTGVGKSGLAHRLTRDEFVETVSTDGVWATQMSLPHNVNTKDTEREIWLWDFAGQPDYRLIHRLFMNETALAVLVFNPQESNPFEGLGEWDRDIGRAATRPFKKLLVAGRCDVGGLIANQKSLDEFIKERKFDDFIETSALYGTGCEKLREAIIANINWNEIPHTASPRIFKLLKEEIIRLKDEGGVLMRVAELKQQLEMRLAGERFNIRELRAVIGLLSNSGVVWELEFGDFVLLQPERINSYAAAVIRTVRAHPDEMGFITEEDVLAGNLKFEEMKRLPPDEEEVVLRAMLQIFVRRGLCLRETGVGGTLLIFPSYFKRDRPEQSEHPADFATYRFSGALDEIYATLVVRLHNTKFFHREVRLWRYAADFKTLVGGKTLGLKMEKAGEGAAKIIVYLEPDIADETKVTFSRFIHDFLLVADADMRRERHYVCPKCFEAVANPRAVTLRLDKGLKDIGCQVCEERIILWDSIEEMFASDEMRNRVRLLDEKSRLATDNESKEMLLEAHARYVAAEAGQIYRGYTNSDWGIDGEIEFRNYDGNASGKRVYLQLKSGDSYLRARKRDEKQVFDVKPRHAEYWQAHNYDVMLVIRTSDGETRWMNATEYLKKHGTDTRQIVFDGEPFVWQSIIKLRDKLIPPPPELMK